MEQQPTNPLTTRTARAAQIERVFPKAQPELTQKAVMWESEILLDPKGKRFTTEDLHDFLKVEIQRDKLPVKLYYAEKAYWVILGAKNRLKEDSDRRPRIVATLKESPYTDIQFIAGIDYFGESQWANVQMMIIVQPQEKESLRMRPTEPVEPKTKPLISYELLAIAIVVAGVLLSSGNGALQVLGLGGGFATFILFLSSNSTVKEAQDKYAKDLLDYRRDLAGWEAAKERLREEQEETEKNLLSRSFKWDDLRIFKEVISRYVLKVVYQQLIQQGATVKKYVDISNDEKLIENKDKNNPFDEFEG